MTSEKKMIEKQLLVEEQDNEKNEQVKQKTLSQTEFYITREGRNGDIILTKSSFSTQKIPIYDVACKNLKSYPQFYRFNSVDPKNKLRAETELEPLINHINTLLIQSIRQLRIFIFLFILIDSSCFMLQKCYKHNLNSTLKQES